MNPPPPYPATRSQGLALPLFEESSHRRIGRPGRLAPKWLEDFLAGSLQDSVPLHLDIGCANIQVRRALATAAGATLSDRDSPPVVRHELLVKGHQCSQSGRSTCSDDRPGEAGGLVPGADGKEHHEIYSCVCQNCRYHFTFYIERGGESPCSSKQTNCRDPYHHLVFSPTDDDTWAFINMKYYPLHGRSLYICSASQCSFAITVEVSEPRLKQHFLDFLTDNDRINKRLIEAKAAEPERFADVLPPPPNALYYLRIYLQDIVKGGSEDAGKPDNRQEKRISQRNKKFHVHFGDGPEATELFNFLEFKEVADDGNLFWKVPTPEIMRPTRPGSQLAFFQDIKSEIETIVGKNSENLKPNSAINFIMTALSIDKYATTRVVHEYVQYSSIDYDILGLLPDMNEAYFWYAFTCQRQADPSKEPAFFGALQRLTRGRNNEELEIKVQSYDSMRTAVPVESSLEEDEIRRATEESLKEMQQPVSTQVLLSSEDAAVGRAYTYFGLQADQSTDDQVLSKFDSLCESYPSQRSAYREKLLLIARKTGSKRLQERAVDSMGLPEALDYLGVQRDTETEYIVNIAQFSSNSGEKDYVLIATALRVIGVARNNNATLLQAASIIMAGHDQSYQFGSPHDNRMDITAILDDRQVPVDLNLPVGLQNIRNTCYLNSILQYFFTVKPIREIVLNWKDWGLEITEENLRNRRIDPGSTRLEKADAYAGQQFAFELSSLFTGLLTSEEAALKPPQRLALAALKNPNQLETDGTKILAKDQPGPVPFGFESDSSTDKESAPPPLPMRNAPPPPVPPRNAQTAKVHVSAVPEVEAAESTSTHSSQTLVNQQDEPAMTDGPAEVRADKAAESAEAEAEAGMGSVQMVFEPPPTRPVEAEPTVEDKIERALNDSSVTGTDQQDVEEVMGNIISHLRAAVKATGEDAETGAQRDPVTDTFFWTSVTYGRTNEAKEFSRQVAPNRWVTAFPDENGAVIGLLEALDNNFHREFITQGSTRYERFTSILKLPPILHIHIQRTTRDGGKNNTAIEIPQTLCLDRFMDSPIDSELFRRRRRAWNLQERLRSLRGPNGEVVHPYFTPDALVKAAAYTETLVGGYLGGRKAEAGTAGEDKADRFPLDVEKGDLGEEEEEEGGFFIIDRDVRQLMDENGVELPAKAAGVETAVAGYEETVQLSGSNRAFVEGARDMSRDAIKEAWEAVEVEVDPEAAATGASESGPAKSAVQAAQELMARVGDKSGAVQQELDGLFAGMQAQAYRLHAVICHAGQTGKSGHYWVWVYDFRRQLWRRYNDSVVTEEPDTAKVMHQLSTQGEPYYLAYVRAADVDAMVDIPRRNGAVAAEAEADAEVPWGEPGAAAEQADESDTEMVELVEIEGTEGSAAGEEAGKAEKAAVGRADADADAEMADEAAGQQ